MSTRIVRGATSLELDLPETIVPGSIRGELKFYPDVISHVIEGIEAGLIRPYGCGEQTISSTYPSLLLLQYGKDHPLEPGIAGRARRYLQLGYAKLLNYRESDGGFSYWGHGYSENG